MQIFKLNEIQGENLSDLNKYLIRRDAELEKSNEMLVDSERVIDRAIKAGVHLRSVLLTHEALERNMTLTEQFHDLKIFVGSEQDIQALLGGHVHQTMMSVAERPRSHDYRTVQGHVVFLNGLEDPQNIGAILRNCHAFEIKNVLLGPKCCSPYSRRSIRVSMGSVFWPNICFVSSLEQSLQDLQAMGYSIVGAHLGSNSQNIRDFEFKHPTALIIGSEFRGLCKSALDFCEATVKIPIAESVDSLNAASASAILLDRLSSSVK